MRYQKSEGSPAAGRDEEVRSADSPGARTRRSTRTHPAFWVVLLVSYGIFILAPIIIAKYPLPDDVLNWCPNGAETGHYTVESVASFLLALVGVAGVALALAAATLTPRVIWIRAPWILFAIGSGLGAFWLAAFVRAGEIDCAFI
jgi:uncharacterized membrane protein